MMRALRMFTAMPRLFERTSARGRRAVLPGVLLVALAGGMSNVAQAAPTEEAPRIAPDFALRSLAGSNVRLHELRGQVVLLNFWANACAPCRQNLPRLAQWQAQYREAGLTVFAIDVDEDAQAARTTVERLDLNYAVLLDTDKTVSRAYALGALPTTVLIDRDGQVRAVMTKDGAAGAELERQLQDLLKE